MQDNELALVIGRLEGKVDTLITLQADTAKRLDASDVRADKTAEDLTVLKTKIASDRKWVGGLASAVGALAGIAVAYFKGS